jgi:hypothetical protein
MWHKAGYYPKEIQLLFLRFTAQMIIKDQEIIIKVAEHFKVKATDPTYQILERNPLSTS